MSLTRRAFLASSTAILALGASRAKAQSEPFSHDQVIALAREMAAQEYTPRPTVPQDWIDLSYEQYRSIWFRSKDGLWSHTDRPYEVDFFPPGLYFKRTVGISRSTSAVSITATSSRRSRSRATLAIPGCVCVRN